MEPAAVSGLIFDLQGVLLRGDQPIPGAAAALAQLQGRGVRIVVLTNDSARSPAQWARRLQAHGFDLRPEQVITAGKLAASWIAHRHPGARVLVVGSDDLKALARDEGLAPLSAGLSVGAAGATAGAADVVLIGEGEPFTQEHLVTAAAQVMAGARLVVACLDPQVPTETGAAVCPGSALGHAVGFAARRRPVLAGKPSAWAARYALARLTTPTGQTAMVGDQAEDMRLARAGGLTGLLVLSGLTAAGAWRRWPQRWHPDAVLDDVAALPDWISRHLAARARAGAG